MRLLVVDDAGGEERAELRKYVAKFVICDQLRYEINYELFLGVVEGDGRIFEGLARALMLLLLLQVQLALELRPGGSSACFSHAAPDAVRTRWCPVTAAGAVPAAGVGEKPPAQTARWPRRRAVWLGDIDGRPCDG